MSEQNREFEAFTGAEIAVGSVSLPVTLYAGSKVYEDLTHYPATNTDYPAPTAHDWHPSTLETAGVGIVAPLLLTAGLVAVTSLARRVVHNHRQSPPPRIEAQAPAEV
jgi:hypothetical protein